MSRCMLFLAWLIAAGATFTSMYLSERLFLKPCELCWYQRICLFPLVWILGRAAWKGDSGGIIYSMPLALIGFVLAVYHLLMQEVFHFDPIGLCDFVHECSRPQLLHFGEFALPIPLLATLSFFMIMFCLFIAKNTANESTE